MARDEPHYAIYTGRLYIDGMAGLTCAASTQLADVDVGGSYKLTPRAIALTSQSSLPEA